ncbi:MAG: hypothetical protein AABY64_05160 [Bdellovibrionota bacterium]
MINRGLAFVFSIFCIAGTSPAWSANESVTYGIHHQYVSPRALGMGDAFVAVANDYSAMFYNPAGLAFRDDGELNLSLDLNFTSSFFTFVNEISNASKTGTTESEKQTNIANAVTAQYGKSFGGRLAPTSAVFVRPGWGVAVIPLDLSLELSPNNPVIVNATAYLDTTVAVSYAEPVKSIENAKMSWGVTGKFINRGFFSKSVSFIELAADSNFVKTSDLKEGYFIDMDLGLLYQPHIPTDEWYSILRLARPTFGAVVRNVIDSGSLGSLKLFNKTQIEKPEKLYRVLDIGSRWEYPELFIFKGRGVMDIRDIMHPKFSMKKGLHLGFEFDWAMMSWWKGAYRFGLSQNYFSAGVSAMFTIFNLDLATYGEDVGTFNTPVENRVYMLRANMNF